MNIAQRIASRIAEDIKASIEQVNAAINLLDEGATVPFIARYRKEVTMGLDDTQLRNLEERLTYLRDMEDRRTTIIKSIDEQGKLSSELKQSLMEADTKTRLEDLYAPYKPKRRTKAQIAREAGIEPVLDSLLENPALSPEVTAKDYINEAADDQNLQAFVNNFKKYTGETFEEDKSGTIEIKVLGPGCPRCSQLEQDIMRAMTETGIMGDIEHITDIKEIRRHGIKTTPGLIINGKTLAIGSVPQQSQIEAWLKQTKEEK